jgi:hypothetical protein
MSDVYFTAYTTSYPFCYNKLHGSWSFLKSCWYFNQLCFFGTQWFITVLAKLIFGLYTEPIESILTPAFSETHFNIILPPMPRSPKQSLAFRISD